jgi:hypothetical protein
MEDAEESFGTWVNLSFIAIHKACTTDVCVSLPAHQLRAEREAGASWCVDWLGLPCYPLF